MSEFSLIKQYCQNIGAAHPQTRLGVGDDAALIDVPAEMELAVSVDTMVAGVHFFPDADPGLLAHKLLAVNVSDMVAMGAEPKWATLALSLPNTDEAWLSAYSKGLNRAATHFGLELIGGDTTSGALVMSLQIMGLVPKGEALRRSGAQLDDDLYVSGCLGDAALALSCMTADSELPVAQSLLNALHQPQPNIALGVALRGVATAAIDVSDGLVADVGHIAQASGVSIVIEPPALPLSEAFVAQSGEIDLALYGGDDYQLAFTANSAQREAVQTIARKIGIKLSRIGRVQHAMNNAVMLELQGELLPPKAHAGFDHFEK